MRNAVSLRFDVAYFELFREEQEAHKETTHIGICKKREIIRS